MNGKPAAWFLAIGSLVAFGAHAADAKVVAYFEETCGACHGPKGDGIAGLAPPLKGSAFVKSAKPEDVAAVISKGRAGDQKKFPQIRRSP